MYIIFSLVAAIIGGGMSIFMRMELMNPGVQYMCMEGMRLTAAGIGECTPNGHLWNVLITGHGILMMFFVLCMFGVNIVIKKFFNSKSCVVVYIRWRKKKIVI